MEPLNSKIFRGQVFHERLYPKRHVFTYPVTFFAFDPKELVKLAQHSLLFGYNCFRPLSIYDTDYLSGQAQAIHKQMDALLTPAKEEEAHLLVTCPRFLGLAFNPVNFHFRLKDNQLQAAIAEVNNTFRDRHVYPLHTFENPTPNTWLSETPKKFHVSPFNDLAGTYNFSFKIEPESLNLGVDLHREGRCVMKTALMGEGHPITAANLWKYFLMNPADTALNSFPRILWQAAKIAYQRKLPVYKRPVPEDPNTLLRNEDRDTPPSI
jgi:DUF1365 family protein